MKIRGVVAAAAVLTLLTACASTPNSANIAICRDYMKWSHNQTSASDHTIADQVLYGPGKRATNPAKRDVARALVYYGLWNGSGSGSTYLSQTLAAEGAATKVCKALGVDS